MVLLHHVGYDQGGTSRDSSHAMDKDIGVLEMLVDEMEGCIEQVVNALSFSILHLDG